LPVRGLAWRNSIGVASNRIFDGAAGHAAVRTNLI
jgi:hypothetical protein